MNNSDFDTVLWGTGHAVAFRSFGDRYDGLRLPVTAVDFVEKCVIVRDWENNLKKVPSNKILSVTARDGTTVWHQAMYN